MRIVFLQRVSRSLLPNACFFAWLQRPVHVNLLPLLQCDVHTSHKIDLFRLLYLNRHAQVCVRFAANIAQRRL